MIYSAHISEDQRMQTVSEHLNGVAALAEKNAVEMFKPLAHAAGKAHDLGKYAKAFQDRLTNPAVRYEHSVCGAVEYEQSPYAKSKDTVIPAYMLLYCIAGHHTGLPDGGTANDTDTTLRGRLKCKSKYCGDSDYSAYKTEIELEFPDGGEITGAIVKNREYDIEKFAFFTRYLFSCLTDADYLDTEKFCVPQTDRLLTADFQAVKAAVDKRLEELQLQQPVTELRKARCRLQRQAYINAKEPTDVSILNIPAGSGKTLCSLNIALDKLLASKGQKKRIIYVIPYTSIIEQTAGEFKNIFGKYADILQHHSNYDFDDDKQEPDTAEKLKKAAENWDAPFIVTTSVQFFESLYHYKGSSLRKLHNMADSVIIFDEIHLLPIECLQPCLRGIGYITKYLRSEAVFLSATMPDYSELFKRYLPECSYSVLVRDREDFRYFGKCRYICLGKTEPDSILEKAQEYRSSLIVVNKRRTARDMYKKISGNKYHLSTYMTPNDRSRTIEAIRCDLENSVPVTVVSTSLIEAGVDLDFKAVFREIAGLDNIIQAGGRCNREGRDEWGDVYVFETDEEPIRELQLPVDIVKSLFEEYEDIAAPECIREYYRRLYGNNDEKIEGNSIDDGYINIACVPFRTYAQRFSLISDESVGVVICGCEEAEELYGELKAGNYSVKRRLQKYTVPLKRKELEEAFKQGILDDFGTGVLMLTNTRYYSPETGLDVDFTDDMII